MPALLSAVLSCLLFGLVTVSTVAAFVPQLVRLARTGDPAGLSLPVLLTGSVNYLAWDVYLWQGQAWSLLVNNLLATLVWLALTGLAMRRLALTRACLPSAAWAVLIVTVAVLDGARLGVLLGLGSMLVYLPQAVSVWRATSLGGLSPLTWALTLLQGLVWFAESLPGMLLGGLVFGAVAAIAGTSVLTALVVRGRDVAPQDDEPTSRDQVTLAA